MDLKVIHTSSSIVAFLLTIAKLAISTPSPILDVGCIKAVLQIIFARGILFLILLYTVSLKAKCLYPIAINAQSNLS